MQEIQDEELFEILKGKRTETLTESIQPEGKEIKDDDLLEIIQTIKSDQPSIISKALTTTGDFFSGTKRTEFPDLPEFGAADVSPGTGAKIALGFAVTPNIRTQMDIIKSQIPEVTFTQDKFENIIVVMPDSKGFYLNKPGASAKDFIETTQQVLQYIPGFSWAMKKAGKSWVKKMLLSGVAGGTTSVVQDIAATPLGSKEGLDVPKLAISTFAPMIFEGAINPAVRGLWRTFFGNPRYFKVIEKPVIRDGKKIFEKEYVFTDKGKAAAKAAGLDINKIDSNTIKTFTSEVGKGVEADVAAAQAAAGKFGFRLSGSQARGDKESMAALWEASKGSFGGNTQRIVNNFLTKQGINIENTARNLVNKFNRGQVQYESLEDVGQSIFQKLAKDFVKASNKATTVYNTIDKRGVFNARNSNIDVLKASVNKAIDDVSPTTQIAGTGIIDKELTPATLKGLNFINAFVKRIKSKKVQKTTPTVFNDFTKEIRKYNQLVKAAKNPTDKKNVVAIKKEFEKFFDDNVDNFLFSGNKDSLKALKLANALYKDKKIKFEPNPIIKGGIKIDDKAGKTIQKIISDPDVTPMKTIDWIFGTSGLGRKADALSIIRRLKKIFNAEGKDLGKIAAANTDFQSLRTGFFHKLVKDSVKGNQFSPAAFVKNWETVMSRDKALIKELFDDDEIKLIGDFVTQVRKTFKPRDMVNSSNTASALMRAIMGVARQLIGILGFKTASIQGLLVARSGFDRVREYTGTKAAQKIVEEEIFGIGKKIAAPFTFNIGGKTFSLPASTPVAAETGILQEKLGSAQRISGIPFAPKGLFSNQ